MKKLSRTAVFVLAVSVFPLVSIGQLEIKKPTGTTTPNIGVKAVQAKPITQWSTDGIESQTLPSGVVVYDIKVGTGKEVLPGMKITVHFSGWLKDGTPIDSTHRLGIPQTFELYKMIRGWQVGIPGMKAGGKRRLEIPYMMGYGKLGTTKNIPPLTDIAFDIELLGVFLPDPPPSVEGKKMTLTKSGVKCWDIRIGNGDSPKPDSIVEVFYKGWRKKDGIVFDHNHDAMRARPFRLDETIKGWQEGLLTMKVHGQRLLEVPPEAAYGEEGAPPRVGPNETLVYEIILFKLGVEPAKAPASKQGDS